MKNTLISIAILLFGLSRMAFAQQPKPLISAPGEARLTVNIRHEDGSPVENATVGVSFNQTQNYWQEGHQFDTKNAQTGKTGIVVAEGETTTGWINYGVTKDGYYPSNGERLILQRKGTRYEPWNPTYTLIAKKIVKPIPMYARKVEMVRVPVVGQPVGFDLVVSDWVAPHGKGSVSDLIITLQKAFVDVEQPFEASLSIAFANESDGIQPTIAAPHVGSELRLPRYAPEQGYEKKVIKSTSRAAANQMIVPANKEDLNYFFRVRTVKKDDKIVSSNYGKIDRDIDFDIINSDTALLFFTYYLNPTPNDRNMEFDPKRNLLKGLKDSETVTNP